MILVINVPILFKVALLALGWLYDCLNACEAILNYMGKILYTWAQQNTARLRHEPYA